jgi:hypothetical protein
MVTPVMTERHHGDCCAYHRPSLRLHAWLEQGMVLRSAGYHYDGNIPLLRFPTARLAGSYAGYASPVWQLIVPMVRLLNNFAVDCL